MQISPDSHHLVICVDKEYMLKGLVVFNIEKNKQITDKISIFEKFSENNSSP